LDADLAAAFDRISHDHILAMLGAFPARGMVAQWLKAGVVENGRLSRTEEGTPQGGVSQKVAPDDGYSTPAINQPFEGAVRDLPSASFSTDAGRCTTRLDLRACARGNQRIRLARRVRTRSRWRPSVIAAPATIITTIGSEHDQCSECLGGFSEAGRDAEIGVVAQDTPRWRPARAATPIPDPDPDPAAVAPIPELAARTAHQSLTSRRRALVPEPSLQKQDRRTRVRTG
jgi:hypothetical protein